MERLKRIIVSSILLVLTVSVTAGILTLNQILAAAFNI
ncbi:hypothetical protein AN619_29180 [Thermotalea metallivorans]|uniref:Uncharacterized protein n=1 Tax=Thermotalea metallivorans TaxID=520762 RepID=A0A140KZM8_9FIRM|nr:hypothetical protein AN619_29180 [Thermotalea metallivorans]